jgi:hypothetical protein
MVQQTAIGTASRRSRKESDEAVATGANGLATATGGALCTFGAGAVMSGCVFAIFTVGAGGAAGSGKILMRAVSFFGPA